MGPVILSLIVPYIAPEEFEGGEYDGREVDIWAAGVIYYTMRYSSLPWLHASIKDPRYKVFLKSRLGNFQAIDDLTPECRDLMNTILEPNPKVRCNSQFIVDSAWFKRISGNLILTLVCCRLEKETDGQIHYHFCRKKLNEWNRNRVNPHYQL